MTNCKISNKKYDLEERTSKFSEDVIDFIKGIKKDDINNTILTQLIRAVTSVGANYCEADCAESKKDFIHKIGICNKEAKESKYWFRILAKFIPERINECRKFWKEAQELNFIFLTIIKNTKGR